jgi:cation:H+ antiporter
VSSLIIDIIILIVAMGALIKGAGYIIVESEKIAKYFKISPFVIGATLIAVGTSLPEMVASMFASYKGHGELAVSNVIGSNIFNIALVLGTVFIIAKKIEPKRDIFKEDSAWALFPILAFLTIAYDDEISRFDGFIYIMMMVSFLIFLKNNALNIVENECSTDIDNKFHPISTILFLLLGFIFVIVGANYTVESASSLAKILGVSEWIIGLLVVALGTSMPELVVSIVALKKGQADMAIGNIIGSNIANFTMVIGASALLSPMSIDFANSLFDVMAALILTIMLVLVAINKLYNRSTGIVFILMFLLVIEHSLRA